MRCVAHTFQSCNIAVNITGYTVDVIPVLYHTMHPTDFRFKIQDSSHTTGQSDNIMPLYPLYRAPGVHDMWASQVIPAVSTNIRLWKTVT